MKNNSDMITKNEKQLIHLTKMNSDDGFAELARRYQPLMYKLASEFIDGGRLSPDAILTNAASGRKTCRSGQPQHPAAGFPLHHGWHGGCP